MLNFFTLIFIKLYHYTNLLIISMSIYPIKGIPINVVYVTFAYIYLR